VLVPSLTFAATANAVTYVGARPVFLDSERATWNVDPALIEEELASRVHEGRPLPAAAIVVDLYGQCADYEPILAACAAHGVPVIEDAAEALGATYRGRAAGSFGVLNVFSFNGNKVMTTSGGGMLAGEDPAVIARTRHLSTQARDPAPHYEHSEIGFNYRMSNLLAALGRAQLAELPDRLARRRQINAEYRRQLAGLCGLEFMPVAEYGEPSHWLTVVQLDPATARRSPEEVRLLLEQSDVEARPTWKPLHLQPVFADSPTRRLGVSERIFERGLCLPSGSDLTGHEQDKVVSLIRSALEQQ
jgi:dTDP-4-amino-4,6-dideoxygalactose transaminase